MSAVVHSQRLLAEAAEDQLTSSAAKTASLRYCECVQPEAAWKLYRHSTACKIDCRRLSVYACTPVCGCTS